MIKKVLLFRFSYLKILEINTAPGTISIEVLMSALLKNNVITEQEIKILQPDKKRVQMRYCSL
jgi:hypothetical protein